MSKSTVNSQQSTVVGGENKQKLFGLVLAGGKSSRMGRDKGLIEFNGKPQREYLFDLLNKFCVKVFLSCKQEDHIPPNLNPLVDTFEIESPLNGILSAFQKHADVAWLTIAVDMPLIDEGTIQHLISQRSINDVATCYFDSEGKNPEPLLTLWEPKASSLLMEYYNSGKISPRDFLKRSPVKIIEVFNKNVLININSPEELQKFKEGQKNQS